MLKKIIFGIGCVFNLNASAINDINDSSSVQREIFQQYQALQDDSITIIQNNGQVHEKVRFYAQLSGGIIWFSDNEVVFDFIRKKNSIGELKNKKTARKKDVGGVAIEIPEFQREVIRMQFSKSLEKPRVQGRKKKERVTNFIYGNNPDRWVTNVPNFSEVYYENIYPNIDVRFYQAAEGVEYDFIVHPEGDPENIEILVQGIDGLSVDTKGNLILKTEYGKLKHTRPEIYQFHSGEKERVLGEFDLISQQNAVKSQFAYKINVNAYAKTKPLIIDPIIDFSTYLGGSASDLFYSESPSSMVVDNDGALYVAGGTASFDFPSVDAIYPNLYGETDGYLFKLSKNGQKVEYATYLGGSSEDGVGDIAIDSKGNLIVAGSTSSIDFPTVDPIYPNLYGGGDAFVFKISSDGQTVLYSTYVGGTNFEEGNHVVIDKQDNMVIAGYTTSDDFPTINPIYPNRYGSSDIFVLKLSESGQNVMYSTYVGGSGSSYGQESVTDMDIDAAGNIYITGDTWSSDFPTVNAQFSNLFGPKDAFVMKIKADGDDVAYSTYLGGTDQNGNPSQQGIDEQGSGIVVDSSGNAYVVGETRSDDFYTTSDALIKRLPGGVGSAGFVTIFNASGIVSYSSYLGGSYNDSAESVTLDNQNNILISGNTESFDFPVQNPAMEKQGSYDAFITKLSNNGHDIMFSTYWGGSDVEWHTHIETYGDYILMSGVTRSNDFPTNDAKYKDLWGADDGFIMKIKPDLTVTGKLDHFDFSNVPSPQIIRALSFPITIRARDKNLNHLTTFNGKISLTSSSGLIFPTEITMINGIAASEMSFYDVGETRLIASGYGVSGKSNVFTVEDLAPCTGKLEGSVVDLRDNSISSASVSLTGNGITRNKSTNSNGDYTFGAVPCNSNYEILVEKEGQTSRVKQNVGGLINIVPNIQLSINPRTKDIPVILVPGILGSSLNKFGYPQLPKELPAPANNLEIYLEGIGGWNGIESDLEKLEYNVFRCPWDWRMNIDKAYKEYLIPCIDRALMDAKSNKVHIVAHSMGGLLTRAYIQGSKYTQRNDIEKFAMVGTPNTGSSNAYYIWEGGDPKLIDDISDEIEVAFINAYTNSIQTMWEKTYKMKNWNNSHHDKIRTFVQDKAPSLLELMNTDNFLLEESKLRGTQVAGNTNNWLNNLNNDPDVKRMSKDGANGTVLLGVFAGSKDNSVVEKISVGQLNSERTLYPDGIPINPSKHALVKGKGDGTVPLESALLPVRHGYGRIIKSTSQKSHAGLVKDYRSDITNFLESPIKGKPVSNRQATSNSQIPLQAAGVNNLSFSTMGSIRMDVTDPTGKHIGIDQSSGSIVNQIPGTEIKFNNDHGVVDINTPKSGVYTIKLFGVDDRDFIFDTYLLTENKTGILQRRGFYSGQTIMFNVKVDLLNAPHLRVVPPVSPVFNLQANITATMGTRLTWEASVDPNISRYNIYEKMEIEPYFSLVASVPSGTREYTTAHLWSSDSNTPTRAFAVTVEKASGKESFFSEEVLNNDQDHDGLSDEQESEFGSDMTKSDTDGDGLIDLEEMNYGTNPRKKDTDGDGYNDADEINVGTNPLDKKSHPVKEGPCTFFVIKASNGHTATVCL